MLGKLQRKISVSIHREANKSKFILLNKWLIKNISFVFLILGYSGIKTYHQQNNLRFIGDTNTKLEILLLC